MDILSKIHYIEREITKYIKCVNSRAKWNCKASKVMHLVALNSNIDEIIIRDNDYNIFLCIEVIHDYNGGIEFVTLPTENARINLQAVLVSYDDIKNRFAKTLFDIVYEYISVDLCANNTSFGPYKWFSFSLALFETCDTCIGLGYTDLEEYIKSFINTDDEDTINCAIAIAENLLTNKNPFEPNLRPDGKIWVDDIISLAKQHKGFEKLSELI